MKGYFKLDKYYFKWEDGIVEMYGKATKKMIEEEKKWREEFGDSLLDINEDGMYFIESAGLTHENWKHVETRKDYLSVWIDEHEEEARCLAAEYEMYG